MCDHEDNHDNSSFLFGMIIGAVIGAIIAIIIYRQHRDEIIKFFKDKFDFYFKAPENDHPSPSAKPRVIATNKPLRRKAQPHAVTLPVAKQEVVLPPEIVAETQVPTPTRKTPSKRFIKPKK